LWHKAYTSIREILIHRLIHNPSREDQKPIQKHQPKVKTLDTKSLKPTNVQTGQGFPVLPSQIPDFFLGGELGGALQNRGSKSRDSVTKANREWRQRSVRPTARVRGETTLRAIRGEPNSATTGQPTAQTRTILTPIERGGERTKPTPTALQENRTATPKPAGAGMSRFDFETRNRPEEPQPSAGGRAERTASGTDQPNSEGVSRENLPKDRRAIRWALSLGPWVIRRGRGERLRRMRSRRSKSRNSVAHDFPTTRRRPHKPDPSPRLMACPLPVMDAESLQNVGVFLPLL
jgi:hypothetical protein